MSGDTDAIALRLRRVLKDHGGYASSWLRTRITKREMKALLDERDALMAALEKHKAGDVMMFGVRCKPNGERVEGK